MVILSHPTGNANVRNAALALVQQGLLSEFWTTVAWPFADDSALGQLLPDALSKELGRRGYPPEVLPFTRQRPLREIARVLANRFAIRRFASDERSPIGIDAVYRSLDRAVASRMRRSPSSIRAVYAYEDGAAASFAAARQLDLHRIYDLPIGYWRAHLRILSEEAEANPEWASTLQITRDSAAKLERKDDELGLASSVIVPSKFVQATLREAPMPVRSVVVPFGAPDVSSPLRRKTSGPKLRVIFVGSLGQRKGLSYLFEAVRKAGSTATLTVIGQRPSTSCVALDKALESVEWIPTLTHREVLRILEEHDVFVFPSLFEGYGLVLLEAMSRGLPVIATPHTGAPDFVTDGVDGFIVPIRCAESIAEKLLLLARDRERLHHMSQKARETASRMSWHQYRSALVRVVNDVVGESNSQSFRDSVHR